MTNLETFIKDSSRDPAVESALKAAPTKEEYARTAVRLGRQKGYNFTEAEVTEAMSRVSQRVANGQQLSEAQLESVAGGEWCSLSEWWYQRFTSGAVKC